MDKEEIIRRLKKISKHAVHVTGEPPFIMSLDDGIALDEAVRLLEEQRKEIKALHLLVEWAEECDFGFDQFPDEYERYKDEIKGMKYIDGMIHIAKRTLEDHGAFEEGR